MTGRSHERPMRWFASDNNASVHPEVMNALARANTGHALAYGLDPQTRSAAARVAQHFGDETRVFFGFTGTAANVLAISALLRPYEAVICTDCAHLHIDECGALERFAGCKILPIAHHDGKLSAEAVEHAIQGVGDEHHVQPRLVSISQATEVGTVYGPEEIQAIADVAGRHGLFLHIDGARLANAAASLGLPLRAITTDCGADAISLGGTKNGLMFGEAIVFPATGVCDSFAFVRKQGMQLGSKMRFLAVQFEALFGGDLWLRNAAHANDMAARLAERVGDLAGIEVTRPVQANAVFATVPERAAARLRETWPFYTWEEDSGEVRWMTAWDTTARDVDAFAAALEEALARDP